jgi:hypothetical protein
MAPSQASPTHQTHRHSRSSTLLRTLSSPLSQLPSSCLLLPHPTQPGLSGARRAVQTDQSRHNLTCQNTVTVASANQLTYVPYLHTGTIHQESTAPAVEQLHELSIVHLQEPLHDNPVYPLFLCFLLSLVFVMANANFPAPVDAQARAPLPVATAITSAAGLLCFCLPCGRVLL